MKLTQHLLDTFRYNDFANRKLLEKIRQLPDPAASVRLFSHLINCQHKWMARVKSDPRSVELDWWEPLYPMEDLEKEWEKSLAPWLAYLESTTDDAISEYVSYVGFDGGTWASKPKDIALQLNYHSIHHRAQMQTFIRQQGLEPDFLDYIGTVFKKLS